MTELTLFLLAAVVVAVLATVVSLRGRLYARAAGAAAAAVVCGWWLSIVAPLLTLALVVAVAGGGFVRFTRTSATVARWGARSRRKSGVASTVDIARVASAAAMRRKAPVVRPSLGGLTRWQRTRVATSAVAIALCRVGAMRVWASVEDVVLAFGGPRAGKTGWLAGAILDAPGAVLTTSTRLDLHELTAGLRAAGGRPVWVFNPAGLGGLDSTVTFDPLSGCTDPVTATERAEDMIPAAEGDAERWDAQARRVLSVLLHAAALLAAPAPAGGVTAALVAEWVADPMAAERELLAALRRSPDPGHGEVARQFIGTNDRTRTSITASIMPALAWLTSPPAVAATSGGQQLDVAELLCERGTVYLLGRHAAHTAPLLAALTGYIARESRRLAAHQPGGRLDPPLTLALDEAARIAPVPLPDWTGDAGGSGVSIIAAFQSRADVIDRWGATGAAKVINNAGAILLFGGTKDDADLDAWSKLAGERDEPVTTTDASGHITSRTVRRVPVLPPSQLANLPRGRIVVFTRGMAMVIGRVQMAWQRRDVRTQARAARARVAQSAVTGAQGARPAPGGAGGLAPERVWAEATREDRP